MADFYVNGQPVTKVEYLANKERVKEMMNDNTPLGGENDYAYTLLADGRTIGLKKIEVPGQNGVPELSSDFVYPEPAAYNPEDSDILDDLGDGISSSFTAIEPIKENYEFTEIDDGFTPKTGRVDLSKEADFAVVDNFAYPGTLTDVDKVNTQQGFQNPSQTVEELSFTPKTGERPNLVKLSPIESEITSENFDNLEFWNSVHTTNTLKNKNDIKIESTLDGPKINIETAQSKVGTEITVAPIEKVVEKVALSADALRQQELREIETHVVTGPPNAAAVDFIKKEKGTFQDENTSFESKLANDPNATVDNTYFPPTTPREPIITSGETEYLDASVDAIAGFTIDRTSAIESNISTDYLVGNSEVFIPYFDKEGNQYPDEASAIAGFRNEKYQEERLKEAKQNEIISQQTADRNLIRKADDKVAADAAIKQSAKEHDELVQKRIDELRGSKEVDAPGSPNALAIEADKSARIREEEIAKRIQLLKDKEIQRQIDIATSRNFKNDVKGDMYASEIKANKRSASLAEQLAEMNEQYELASDASGEQATRLRERKRYQDSRVAGIPALEDDPFKFSTLAYPRNVSTDLQNGHFMLFYINVQNKTKYSYTGVEEIDGISQYVRVGDIIEKKIVNTFRQAGVEQGFVDASAGSGVVEDDKGNFIKTTYEYVTGASEEFSNQNLDVAYKKRQVGTGQRGNLIQSDGTDLRKHRRPQTGINSFLPTTTRITDSIALYLPPNVSNNIKAGYQDFETGMAGYLAMGGMDVINKIKNHDFQGAADTFINKGGTIGVEMLKKFGLAAVSAFTGGEGVEQTFNKAFGQTLNPYLEVAYTSMGVRTFTYTFKFAPQSSEETQDVQAIIQAFRFHMAPELKGTNHRYLTLPSTFDIHYMFQSAIGDEIQAKENSFYNKIATCVLQSVDVNYTPDGVKSFHDGAPTQITMDLSFMETEMLTKQKINEGF